MKLRSIVLSMAVLASPLIYADTINIDNDYVDMGYVNVNSNMGYISKAMTVIGKPTSYKGRTIVNPDVREGYVALDKYLVRLYKSSENGDIHITAKDRKTETAKDIKIDVNGAEIKQVGSSLMYTVLQSFNSDLNEEVYQLVIISNDNKIYTGTLNFDAAYVAGEDLKLMGFQTNEGNLNGYDVFAIGRIPALGSIDSAKVKTEKSEGKFNVNDFALIVGVNTDQGELSTTVLNSDGVISDQKTIRTGDRPFFPRWSEMVISTGISKEITNLKRAAFTSWIDIGGVPAIGLSLTMHYNYGDDHAIIFLPNWYIGQDDKDHYVLTERDYGLKYGIGGYDVNAISRDLPFMFAASNWVADNGSETLSQRISIFSSDNEQTDLAYGIDDNYTRNWPYSDAWTVGGRLTFDEKTIYDIIGPISEDSKNLITAGASSQTDGHNCIIQGLVLGAPPSYTPNNGKVTINLGSSQTISNGSESTDSEGFGVSFGGLTADFSGQLELNTSFAQMLGISDSVSSGESTNITLNPDEQESGYVFCINPSINIRYGLITDLNNTNIGYYGSAVKTPYIQAVPYFNGDATKFNPIKFNTNGNREGDGKTIMDGSQSWNSILSETDKSYLDKLRTLQDLKIDGVITETWESSSVIHSIGNQSASLDKQQGNTQSSKNTIKIEEKAKAGIDDVFNINESYSHEWTTSSSTSNVNSQDWTSFYLGEEKDGDKDVQVSPVLYHVDVAYIKANKPEYVKNEDKRHEDLWFVSDYMWKNDSSFWMYAYIPYNI